jgi:hypothetical protein
MCKYIERIVGTVVTGRISWTKITTIARTRATIVTELQTFIAVSTVAIGTEGWIRIGTRLVIADAIESSGTPVLRQITRKVLRLRQSNM